MKIPGSDELSPETIDQIIFGMENQDANFVFDAENYSIATTDPTEDDKRYIQLPPWNSTMGFQLMERFVSTLRNPLSRDLLRETLAGGRGVFRKFKNVLRDMPEIEKLWFRFKDREMRLLVNEWYNDYRESIGLDRIAFDEEETSELVLSDFSITEPVELSPERIEELNAIDLTAFREMYLDYPDSVVSRMYERSRNKRYFDAPYVLLVETPDGSLAGFILSDIESTSEGFDIAWVYQITVLREYRGLGIAGTLLDEYVLRAARRGIDRLFLELGGEVNVFLRTLEAKGFRPCNSTYALDVVRYSRENLIG